MLYEPTTAQHLKPWLVRTLEPICDAEPGALAEYILALLKHNVPENEMRKELSSQLEEFLEKEGPSFIDTLFTVLRTKSYLPYTASDPTTSFSLPSHSLSADTGIPIPLDGLLSSHSPTSQERGQKRSMVNDDRDGRPPTKGPRLSTEGQFSRYSNGRDSRSTGGWSSGQGRTGSQAMLMNGVMGSGMNGSSQNSRRPQNYQPPDQRKGVCRDYHNNGYCARGALCKYSHGDDAFIPSQMFPMNGNVPFLPMFAGMPFGMAQGAPYDPHEARMDMHPNGVGMGRGMQQRAPLLPRDEGSQVIPPVDRSGELPVIQDLTPQIPPESEPPTAPAADRIPQSSPPVQQQPIQHMDVDMGVSSMPGPSTYNARGGGGFGGGMRGAPRGRGVFGGDAQMFRPERRQDKTLVVEKIPEDKLNLDAVNSWFKRFGTVTNVAIDVHGSKALVSFSDHSEAHAAWKSEDAVFGNRFVKVFWHRPMEGHGQHGTRMLAASAPLLANLAARSSPTPSAPPQPPAPHAITPARKPLLQSTAASELAAKQKVLEQHIAEQKSLMASLETASPEEKKEILARLRKLGEEMKIASVPSTSATPAKVQSPAPSSADHERKERERLDKELELHAGGESTEELKAKLAKLREEAASLGIPAAGADTSYGAPYRGYRGRGRGVRGGAFYRGSARGGPPRASMKLDNRPKKLLVKGVREDAIQALRDWYETTGQLESAEIIGDDEVVISFKTRAAAEQGFAKGSNIAALGPVKLSWHTAQPSQARPAVSAPSPQPAATKDANPEDTRSASPIQERRSSPRPQEEEVVASGWGDGDEDGMGMF